MNDLRMFLLGIFVGELIALILFKIAQKVKEHKVKKDYEMVSEILEKVINYKYKPN